MGDGLAMKLTPDKQRGYADSIRALIKEYDTASGNNKICERSNPEMCVIADSLAPAAATESAQPNFARGLIFAPALHAVDSYRY
jgi:hypothetical protein